jgi:3-methylfumaryl-CoA hydratase
MMTERKMDQQKIEAMESVTLREMFTPDFGSRISAMLGVPESDWINSPHVPFGWHFALIRAAAHRCDLRADGFAGLGIKFPETAERRLLAAGRHVTIHGPLKFGQEIKRTSRILSVTPKTTEAGSMTIVKVEHSLYALGETQAILTEGQTYITLDANYVIPKNSDKQDRPLIHNRPAIVKTITPDDTMLFKFSALSFNSHKIHLDRDYTQKIEGYPDLVVNGGLTTLLMTELLRSKYGKTVKQLTLRNHAPLFVNRPIHFAWGEQGEQNRIFAFDITGRLAAEMEFETNDI